MKQNPVNGLKKSGVIEYLNIFFKKISAFSYDNRWLVAILCLIILSICGYFASSVRFDNSFESYFDRSDPVYQNFLTFRDDFGSDEIAYILYEAPDKKHGPWDIDVMKTLAKITEQLESNVPFIKRVVSLTNVEFMEGINDELHIYDLLEDFPESQEMLLKIRKKVLAKPIYINGLTSKDGNYAAIIIEMEKSSIDPLPEIQIDPEKGSQLSNLYPQATAVSIETILNQYKDSGIKFYHTGDVAINSEYNTISKKESEFLGIISFLVIGLFLLFFFRNIAGVIGPLAVVFLSILISTGFIGLCGWQFDLMFIMLPTILIAVGVADAVHILSDFKTHYMTLEDRREAIKKTAYLTGVPCLFTSLTTTAGFMSMSISPIKSIKHFALYSGVGVVGAFFLSMTFLIVFLSFGKKKFVVKNHGTSKATKNTLKKFLLAVTQFNINHKFIIILVSAVMFTFAVVGIFKIKVDSNFLSEFSNRVEVKRVTQHVDTVMGGSVSYSYIFDTKIQDGIMDPAVLKSIESLQKKAEESDIVLKTYSITDIIKDINKSLHNEDMDYYKIPDDKALTAQYFFFYEMSGGEEINNYVTSDFSRANLEIRTIMADSSQVKKLVNELDIFIASKDFKGIKPETTGMGALWFKLIDYIVDSQLRGFTLAFIVIAVIMCILFGSVKVGMLSMIPNLSPVIITLGVMGWAGIPLDYVKLMIGCIAIGIAVDDTIHLATRFQHEFRESGNYETALASTMLHVGRALFITSIVLISGFLVFTCSIMASLIQFGILVAATILVALAADFFLLPSLILVLKPFGKERYGHEKKELPVPLRPATS